MSAPLLYVADTQGFTDFAVFPLNWFNFTVKDSISLSPVEGAFCAIHEGMDGMGDTVGFYTDSQGKTDMEATWFRPRSWSVTKEGYETVFSNNMVTYADVFLIPVEIRYLLTINSGLGGTTTPRGALYRDPDTQIEVEAIPNTGYVLDHWVYKGENVGSINPKMFLIDRNAITISAVFKRGINGGNGPPPSDWPVVKTDHVFQNVRLDPGFLKEAVESVTKQIDTTQVLGGQIEYSVLLESSLTTASTYWILWNNEILFQEGFQPWNPHGTIKSGMISIPKDKIRNENVLTIMLTQVPGLFNRVLFNVYVTFGYNNEPDDPPWNYEDDWTDWVRENAILLALGGVALGAAAVYLIKPSAPTVVVQIGEKLKKALK